MKKQLFPLITLLVLLTATGCSEKFKIAAPYKNITIINGYLDLMDTAHYIRIQKAFLDQNKSAITMAQSPDSSYYAGLNVKIRRLGILDSALFDTIHLTRVDLNLEGYPKEPGVFFTAPNYAYKFTNKLNPNFIYQIVVTNLATGESDSAKTPIIDDNPNDINPSTLVSYFTSGVFTDSAKIDFSSTLPNKKYSFYAQYTPDPNFSFEGIAIPAVIAQCVLTIRWLDSDYTTRVVTAHSGDFNVGYQSLTSTAGGFGSINYDIPNTQLYDAVSSTLGVAPAHVIRLIDKWTISVYLGTQDFLSYQQNSLVQGVGLTGSEIEPVYTNIKGANALGLFTSRGVRQGTLNLTDQTVDALVASSLTAPQNIKGRAH